MTDIPSPTATSSADPRRQKPVTIRWRGLIGELFIDKESWGAIEWSGQRGAFCIEDAEGECLRHKDSIHGKAVAKEEAIALAEEMIRDGRMPAPEEASRLRKERLRQERERRAKQPSEIRRRQKRDERNLLWDIEHEAQRRDEKARPLYEAIAETLDFTDPELWRSNSFAALRDRLIVAVRYGIAKLEKEVVVYGWRKKTRRLDRAREILRLLDPNGTLEGALRSDEDEDEMTAGRAGPARNKEG
jgi:hypothetical protein